MSAEKPTPTITDRIDASTVGEIGRPAASGLRHRLILLARPIRGGLRRIRPLRALVVLVRSARAKRVAIPARIAFAELIRRERGSGRILEIGPFAWPLLRGPEIAYADVLTTEKIRARAIEIGADPEGTPAIDFVVPPSDLSGISERFRAIVSCHVIEHQPNLIGHLHQVSGLLEPGGRYFLIVPDRRYCADHYLPNSSLAELLSANQEQRTSHVRRTFIEHRALTVHNDAIRHWAGEHGAPIEEFAARLEHADHEFQLGEFVDMHAWHFDPDGFVGTMRQLQASGQIPLAIAQVWPTRRDEIEFFAILERGGEAAS